MVVDVGECDVRKLGNGGISISELLRILKFKIKLTSNCFEYFDGINEKLGLREESILRVTFIFTLIQ